MNTKQLETVTAYKGFDKNLQCRGYQYAIGETFTHAGTVKACSSGFHSCERPLDVLSYYPPATSRFAVVRATGSLSRHSDDSKVASAQLTIEAEIGIPELVAKTIEWVIARCTPEGEKATGNRGAASATGYQGAASATGELGAASATGELGAASATGYQGAASATGELGAASATGEHSVAASFGEDGKARASAGCAIVLVSRTPTGRIRHIFASKVGENGIEADKFYTLNAKGVPVETV